MPNFVTYTFRTKIPIYIRYRVLWTLHFGSMRFPLDGELDFYFEKWVYLIKKNDLESPLIFVLFLKGKQNKKEKP